MASLEVSGGRFVPQRLGCGVGLGWCVERRAWGVCLEPINRLARPGSFFSAGRDRDRSAARSLGGRHGAPLEVSGDRFVPRGSGVPRV